MNYAGLGKYMERYAFRNFGNSDISDITDASRSGELFVVSTIYIYDIEEIA